MKNTNIQIYNKTLISSRKTKKSIQNFKTLGITGHKYYSVKDRNHERSKHLEDRQRENFRKSQGFKKHARRKRRRR